MVTFDGNNILVVGGSSGIGLSLVRKLVSQGANVIVASRSFPAELHELSVTHISYDVTKPEEDAFKGIEMLHGLVYCPGSIVLKPFQRLTEKDFLADFQINVLGAVQVLQALLRPMKKAGSASVVLYSSVAASVGMNFHASIATSKAALEGLGRSLAAELAPSNIRVNVISPSLTDTPLAAGLLDTIDKKAASAKRHPLGRVGTAHDQAALSAFLLSDEASWITGQVIGVDGGMAGVKMF
jgi:3-oxoacyl-[acyl-carrier protein] reductase